MAETLGSLIEKRYEIKISVRNLVEFLLREGDIDNRHRAMVESAMQEGSRIHRMIQKRMGPEYKAEVPLFYALNTENYDLIVEGRADGVIDQNGEVTIDEIKGTYRDIYKMRHPIPVHVAQAKCYAYMYCCKKESVESIRVRMTYCNMESEDIRYFHEDLTYEELEEWFLGLLKEYQKWADYSCQWEKIRQASIKELQFPFPYREGQKDLVSYVYQTIYHQRKLFIEAPTGVGKTISTVFPAVKAMGQGMGEKLFYLTAKTITRTVADEAFHILREKGLAFKSIILTAKEKACFMDAVQCNPENCPYAKGHYDRINDAIYDCMCHEDSYDRETLEAYAMKHKVCPFEFALDMSLFSDGIICDYNYLFDPHVYLKRFFAEGKKENYLFLVDEAHNLVDRGRGMYSAELVKETVLEVRRALKELIKEEREKPKEIIEEKEPDFESEQLTFDMTDMSVKTQKVPKKPVKSRKTEKSKYVLIRGGYADKLVYQLDQLNAEMLEMKKQSEGLIKNPNIEELVNIVNRSYGILSDYMEETEEEKHPITELLLDFYFELGHFLLIYDKLDEHYITYTITDDEGRFVLHLFCVNPRDNLKECMARGRSTILFSATLLPIQYYKDLLGGEENDYEVYAKSVFSIQKRELLIAKDVTTKYDRRTEEEFQKIAHYIHEIVCRRQGNYMVFCPSYSFMKQICEMYQSFYYDDGVDVMIQKEIMSEEDREEFLERFKGGADLSIDDIGDLIGMEIEEETDGVHTLIGFCVMGGIFGEGIDLKNDSLIGAVIIGTGLPQICAEREIIKDYFDDREENGFDYAYRYPGMNKVLQAAGRVIRTQDDIGVIALLDERFLQNSNRRMFPREWESYLEVTGHTIGDAVERFWDSWGVYDRE